MGKQMEFNLKVTTEGPIEAATLTDALNGVAGVSKVELVSFRVKPIPRQAKDVAASRT
jgi:hypothetical protein